MSAQVTETGAPEGTVAVRLRINGTDRQLHIDPRATLLDCIRETVALTGTRRVVITGSAGRVRCT
jgi:xanthine dehydrogenase YagT iron-sulfur-binding subunit